MLENQTESLRVTRMPPPAEISSPEIYSNPQARRSARKNFGLPLEKVLFIFGFDLNSGVVRKNPMAVIDAFRRAFPFTDQHAEDIGLVIKTLKSRHSDPSWDTRKASLSQDPRFNFIEANLEREKLLSLYGCCDSFISLHRSEGLGRGHAEA